MKSGIESKYVVAENVNIHYVVAGKGEAILFLHGFPTSSFLWRNIMTELQHKFMVLAIDLPGYGKSDKRLDDSFSFRYYERILNAFLDNVGIDKVTIGVHDVGGPIGLYWMVQNMERVNRLILFNTLVYPKFSWAVKLFGLASITPVVKSWLTSKKGIKKALNLGIYNKENITEDIIKEYQSYFTDKNSRTVLLKTVQRLSLKGFTEIEEKLHTFTGPIQIIYGEKDKILPKVNETMKKVRQNLPQSNITSIPNCGHFLQEECPKDISEIILDFMDKQ